MTCGMTTAFAHWAHGEPAAAFAAQPMGALLAPASAASAVLGVWTALTGLFWKPLFILLSGPRFWISVSMLWGLSWAYKIAAVRFGG
jgi:hypothetical protein